MDAAKGSAGTGSTLQEALSAALPADFTCSARHVHTPAKPCDPLFSPAPGKEPEQTRRASHLLSIIIHAGHPSRDAKGSEVIAFALEVFVYSTKHLTTIFVSKADSTGYLPARRPSPVKIVATTFLKWLTEQQRRKAPRRMIVLSLFARSQNQYLFPGSADHGKKHVLDDRQLIKWWAKVLDPIFQEPLATTQQDRYQGFITVPGYDRSETARLFAPAGSYHGAHARWQAGNPLLELARRREVPEHAPARSLLPRFPDDPKARFMSDLDNEVGLAEEGRVMVSPSKRKSGRWKSVNNLERFWEAMEFRQECSSGRVVGFLWLIVSPPETDVMDGSNMLSQEVGSGESQQSQSISHESRNSASSQGTKMSAAAKEKRIRPLTGPIIPRKPRLKGASGTHSRTSHLEHQTCNGDGSAREAVLLSQEGYDKAIQTLLHLDFSNFDAARQSTMKWIQEVSSLAGVHDWAMTVVGATKPEAAAPLSNGISSQINDLGGMIKKKRKATDIPPEDQNGIAKTKAETGQAELQVNTLGAGLIRKKPKTQIG